MEEYHIPEETLERLRDPEVIKRQVREGKTFQEILGYSTDQMEKFYQIARHLFERQEYKKAADSFIFLSTLNPYVHNYWLGLGMSEQLQENYQAALLAYAMGILTDGENPAVHYHSAHCYHGQDDIKNAISSLERAVECAGEQEEYAVIKEQASSALTRLKNK